ncbi:MAG: HlyD family efflux transporter periplasmic adaptor subunit [Rhodospirillales bacterium]|nr:HlyD family efflux transporter periplasmic adaptor subunit [Rhodospirillales bacterium]
MSDGLAEPLVALLGLEEHARRAATAPELAFVMVNDTRALVAYRQAVLFVEGQGVAAVSGGTVVERTAPFTLWLERLFRRLPRETTVQADPDALDSGEAEEWAEWLPRHILLIPLAGPGGRHHGRVLFARDEAFTEGETALLERAAASFGFAWDYHRRPSLVAGWGRRLGSVPGWRWAGGVALVLALLIPVHQSVLAPAEVVARNPAIIRAPLEGVVEHVLVRPNQNVAEGDVLFELDRTMLLGKLEVSRRALTTGQAELDQTSQQAFFDPKAKSQLAIVRSRIEERSAELAQLTDLLARSQVKAPREGIAVLDDPADWSGRPVTVGEKVMAVAAPDDVEVEAWLAPADMIGLEPGAPVTLFLNADPLSPVPSHLLHVAYEATPQPDGLLAHRVRAAPAEGAARPRLGLRGTARLDGRQVPLILWLLRRPLAAGRAYLGV